LGFAGRSLIDVQAQIVACATCSRLREYCTQIAREKRAAFRHDTYWAKPVPGFGDPDARLLVLGLAPAAHGANRTGRVFTGDGAGASGDFLMAAMHRNGFSNISTSQSIDDGLMLKDAYIAAAVRCAPPDNKPTLEEIRACQPHLEAEVAQLRHVRVVVALGKIAFDAWWRLSGSGRASLKAAPFFAHGSLYRPTDAPVVIACYHPSRQNTNTGKLTVHMMREVFSEARREIQRTQVKARK